MFCFVHLFFYWNLISDGTFELFVFYVIRWCPIDVEFTGRLSPPYEIMKIRFIIESCICQRACWLYTSVPTYSNNKREEDEIVASRIIITIIKGGLNSRQIKLRTWHWYRAAGIVIIPRLHLCPGCRHEYVKGTHRVCYLVWIDRYFMMKLLTDRRILPDTI